MGALRGGRCFSARGDRSLARRARLLKGLGAPSPPRAAPPGRKEPAPIARAPCPSAEAGPPTSLSPSDRRTTLKALTSPAFAAAPSTHVRGALLQGRPHSSRDGTRGRRDVRASTTDSTRGQGAADRRCTCRCSAAPKHHESQVRRSTRAWDPGRGRGRGRGPPLPGPQGPPERRPRRSGMAPRAARGGKPPAS